MTPAEPTTPVLAAPTEGQPLTPIVDLLAEPTFEECIAHHSRYSDDQKSGRISLQGIPEGHYVAYYDGQIRDHDFDPTALLKRVATGLNVHSARVFVHYPWMW